MASRHQAEFEKSNVVNCHKWHIAHKLCLTMIIIALFSQRLSHLHLYDSFLFWADENVFMLETKACGGSFLNSVTRDATFFRLWFTHPLRHAHVSSSFGVSRCFLLLFTYFQCILGSRHAQFLLFATASRSKVFFDLPLPLTFMNGPLHSCSRTSEICHRCPCW